MYYLLFGERFFRLFVKNEIRGRLLPAVVCRAARDVIALLKMLEADFFCAPHTKNAYSTRG